jgi:hypothetical protein
MSFAVRRRVAIISSKNHTGCLSFGFMKHFPSSSLWTLSLASAVVLALACVPVWAVGPDLDGDGVPNVVDPDIDNDGIPNALDRNIDGGIPKSGPHKGRHIGDHLDNDNPAEKDIDDDGLADDSLGEADIDGDGKRDDSVVEGDVDGDHRLDHSSAETDMDGDGREDGAAEEDVIDGDGFDDDDHYSGVVPTTPPPGAGGGKVVLVRAAEAPAGAKAKAVVKVQFGVAGLVALEVEVERILAGDYELIVGGVSRGVVTVVGQGGQERGVLRFMAVPKDPADRLLDFAAAGQRMVIRRGETLFFSGVLPEGPL